MNLQNLFVEECHYIGPDLLFVDLKDGKVRVFRMEANAERMQSTCRATMMPELPTETFCIFLNVINYKS